MDPHLTASLDPSPDSSHLAQAHEPQMELQQGCLSQEAHLEMQSKLPMEAPNDSYAEGVETTHNPLPAQEVEHHHQEVEHPTLSDAIPPSVEKEELAEGVEARNTAAVHKPAIQAVNFEQRIEESTQLKMIGNKEFSASRFEEAKDCYQRALGLLDPQVFRGASRQNCIRMSELSANLLYNIGTCFLSTQKWKQAELIYNEAIVVSPTYAKALYKRSIAHYEQQNYEEAMRDIKYAFELDKANESYHEMYAKVVPKFNQHMSQSRQKLKQFSSKIFSPTRTVSRAHQKVEAEQGVLKEQNKHNSIFSGIATALSLVMGAYVLYSSLRK